LEAQCQRWASTGSRVKKSRRSLIDEELRSRLQNETIEERLDEILETVSLKNVPLEERRKEAQKPLFLTRYE
jgi:regulator of replication initiation timing